MLTDFLPYILVLWRGIFRKSKLDHLVLCVCESVDTVNQFLKGVGRIWLKYFLIKVQFSRVILSGVFSMFDSLKRGAAYVFCVSKSTLAVEVSFVKYKVF